MAAPRDKIVFSGVSLFYKRSLITFAKKCL